MFFLLRCAFWLGLVFFNMDWRGGDSLLPSPDQAARVAAARCLASPDICAKVVSGAQNLYMASIAGRAPPKASTDTLMDGDRRPAWQEPRP